MSWGHLLSDCTPWEGKEAPCIMLQPVKVLDAETLGLSERLPRTWALLTAPSLPLRYSLYRSGQLGNTLPALLRKWLSRGPLSAEGKLKIQKIERQLGKEQPATSPHIHTCKSLNQIAAYRMLLNIHEYRLIKYVLLGEQKDVIVNWAMCLQNG